MSLVAETSQQAVKKLRTEFPPTFKRIGNKIQESLHAIDVSDVEKAKEN